MNTTLRNTFENLGMTYDQYFQTIGKKYLPYWEKNLAKIKFSDEQINFLRQNEENKIPINILVFACDFCPDCQAAIPIFQRITDFCTCINWKIVDRDADKELFSHYKVNDKGLIPTVLFLNQEFDEVTRWIERSVLGYELVFEARKKTQGRSNEEFKQVKQELFKQNSKKLMEENIEEIFYALKRAIYMTSASHLALD